MKIGQSVLEIRRLTGCTIVQLWDANKTLVNERMFQGAIDYITVKRETMYILLNGNLYIFDHLLNIVDLPIRVGDVHRLAINHHSDVFYISTKGIIRGFNHRTQ